MSTGESALLVDEEDEAMVEVPVVTWGSTAGMQREIREWAEKALGLPPTAGVLRQAYGKMRALAEASRKEDVSADELGLMVADVVMPLLLMGSLVQRDIGNLVRLRIAQHSRCQWSVRDDGTWEREEASDG